MKARIPRALATAALLVLLAATTIPAPIAAQPRLAPAAFDCSTVTELPLVECQSLVVLYNGTNGEGWTSQSDWLVADTPCSWYGVTCTAGHVHGLSLDANQLSGSIPPELGNLANLTHLYLDSNQLSGSMPPQLGNLTNLSNLSLSSNQLSGRVPPELGNLANLYSLVLVSNQLRGPLPQSLTSLHTLRVFIFDVARLCMPDNAAFAAWFQALVTKPWASVKCKTCYLPALVR